MAKTRARTVEVDGIEVTVAIDPLRDYEFVELSYTSADPEAGVAEKNRAYFRRNRLLLGAGYDRVMGELREAHGGELDKDVVSDFMARIIAGAVEAKN